MSSLLVVEAVPVRVSNSGKIKRLKRRKNPLDPLSAAYGAYVAVEKDNKTRRKAKKRKAAVKRRSFGLPNGRLSRNPSQKAFGSKGEAKAYAKELRESGHTARMFRLPGGTWVVEPGFSKRKKAKNSRKRATPRKTKTSRKRKAK